MIMQVKNIFRFLFCVYGLGFLLIPKLTAQQEAASGEVFFNYGSVSNSVNPEYNSSFTIGQPCVSPYYNTEYQGAFGFWARFLVAPTAPLFTASEGDFPDRVLLQWSVDPLSPASDLGFKIYRDGAFLATVSPSTLEFIDFNVIPGNFYDYEVRGVNIFGEGTPAPAIGFVNPNGKVSGQVTSINDNPVSGVQVTLEPTIGTALSFNRADGDYVEVPYNSNFSNPYMTVSGWIKLGSDNIYSGIADLGRSTKDNWYILTTNTNNDSGIIVGIGEGGTHKEGVVLFENTPNDWHHVAFTYNSTYVNIYLDGELKETFEASMNIVPKPLTFGTRTETYSDFYDGKLDDFRIYNRQLSQSEIIRTMNATVPSNAEGLVAYWKLDEGVGQKIFDLTDNELDGYIHGASFTTDRADVLNAGVTDESGFYLIEGIAYGGGQSFTATAAKNFDFNNALEFNATNAQYATIDGFTPTVDTGTIELWFKPFSLSGNQTILANDDFELSLNNANLEMNWGGTTSVIKTLSNTDYVHFAVTYSNGSSPSLVTYVDGQEATTGSAGAISWSSDEWRLASDNSGNNYFTGLIDEIVFYKTARTLAEIQVHASSANTATIEVTDLDLLAYFGLNESVGNTFADQSPNNIGTGTIQNASWTNVVAKPYTVPHEFNPNSRLATLDPSSTSVDNVDFTDISTVSVSGYVRYANTQCFAEGVEILVDGQSHGPPIFTNADGYFVADFEPGASFRLSPRFEEHQFIPAFWDFQNIIIPKSGLVFNDQTTRDVEGTIAGGLCELPIIPDGGTVEIELRSTNTCYSKTLEISEPTGSFKFDDVPPIEYEVAIVTHPIAPINTYFSERGGQAIDLTDRDTALSFIYRAPIQVELSQLDTNTCGEQMLVQGNNYRMDINVFEDYLGQRCTVDSVYLQIDNDLAINEDVDSVYHANKFEYRFFAGIPNITGDFKKPMSVIVQDPTETNRTATASTQAIITGKRERSTDFATTSPEIPLMILHDPPGDQSYAYFSEGNQSCHSFSVSAQLDLSEEIKTTVSLGPDYEYGTPFFSTEVDVTADASFGFTTSSRYSSEYSTDLCLTSTSTLQTQADEIYPGSDMGGDLFVGAAINLIYGATDVLSYNDTTCQYNLSQEIFVRPDGFATEYVYSEAHIRDVLIPELEVLNKPKSVAMWEDILAKNEANKASAVFKENRSFDAGVIYEYETVDEKSQSLDFEFEVGMTAEIGSSIGIENGGIGVTSDFSMKMGISIGGAYNTSSTNTTTVGYHLEDNDVGDNFSINILKDKVYGTPVFKTVSGQSSCPHEPNTQHRDEVFVQVLESTQTNIPETEAAVFEIQVGNISPAEHRRVYTLAVDQGGNTDGAIIRINGQAPGLPVDFDLEFGQNVPVTVTVEKGPVEYDYTDLKLRFFAGCERERALDIGIDTDSLFEQAVFLNAHFIESCSDVEIGFPLEDWVVTPATGDTMSITLNGYDKDDTDLELLRLQYRKVGGNGAWINIAEVPKDSLGELFEVVEWDVSALRDGGFEIRALSQCQGGLPSGLSEVIPGRLEREPPELLGSPSPADGVLHASDQIYIEFSENVDCNDLTSLPGALENFVGLFFTATNQPIAIEISCTENRIYLVPNIQNQLIENQILRAEVRGIKDLSGNTLDTPIDWEFYVDRNPLKWVEGAIEDIKYEDEAWLVTRTIRNIGGQNELFTLTNIPSWLNPSTTSGVVPPGGTAVVVFTVPDQLSNGLYTKTIQLENNMGAEPMPIELAVLCRPPVWEINPSGYDYNMTFTLQLDIEGTVSTDEFDLVGAFVGEDLRGFANVEYVPSLDEYIAFLTVYSDLVEGEELSFRIWDASDCLLYGSVAETYSFVNDGLHGTPDTPDTLHTQNIVLKKIPVHDGWNWISFNLDMPDKDINVVLESLDHPQDVLIKDQVSFSQYFNAIGQYAGSLQELGYRGMYQFKGTQNDTITLLGYPIDPDTVNIPIQEGWNWIGYLPQQGSVVDSALASLTPLNGDIVKNQTTFAQYVAGVGWIGSLTHMQSPEGYLLKSSNAGTLIQTNSVNSESEWITEDVMNRSAATRSNTWSINANEFEHSMTMVGIVKSNDETVLKEGDEVAAFVDGEVRGVANPIYVEALDVHLLFLTIYANENNETISFKYRDGMTDEIYEILESTNFEINRNLGTVEVPALLSFEQTTSSDSFDDSFSFDVIPNPFRTETSISINLVETDVVTIHLTDLLGNLVQSKEVTLQAGHSFVKLKGTDENGSPLPSGVYYVNVTGRFGQATRKVLMLK